MRILAGLAVLLAYLTLVALLQMLALNRLGLWAMLLFPVLVAGQVPIWKWEGWDR